MRSPERGDFSVTVTSSWSLPYTSSSGSGEIEPMVRTITVPYQVVEIQTVGAAG